MCRAAAANQSNGLKIESSIHSQMIAPSATGVVHGSSTRNRTNHLPRKSAASTKAKIVHSTTTSTCEITVNTNVLRQRGRKVGREIAAMKVWNPTKSNLLLPTVASLNA